MPRLGILTKNEESYDTSYLRDLSGVMQGKKRVVFINCDNLLADKKVEGLAQS